MCLTFKKQVSTVHPSYQNDYYLFPLAYLLFICTYTTCSIRYWRSSRIEFSLTLLAFLPSVLSFNRPLIVLALTCSKLRASRGCLHSRLVRTWNFHLPLSIMQTLFQAPCFLYLKVSGDFLLIYSIRFIHWCILGPRILPFIRSTTCIKPWTLICAALCSPLLTYLALLLDRVALLLKHLYFLRLFDC
jgi:hypothetical protein